MKSMKQIMGEILMHEKGLCCTSYRKVNLVKRFNFRIKVGNVQMVYFQEVVSYTFLLCVIPTICALLCKLNVILFFQSS